MRTKWTIDFSANSSPPWGSSWGWIACEQVKGALSVCPPNVRGVFPGSEVSKPFPQKGQMTNIFSLASHLIHVANTRFCLWSLNAAVDTQKQMGVAKLAWEQKGLDPCYSKHGSWSSNISMPWKLVRNAESQTSPQNSWVRICMLTNPQWLIYTVMFEKHWPNCPFWSLWQIPRWRVHKVWEALIELSLVILLWPGCRVTW